GTLSHAENVVTIREAGYFRPNRFDGPGEVEPGYWILGAPEPKGQPQGVRLPGHDVPGPTVQPCSVDADQHLVARHLGPGDARQTKDVGGAVGILHDGPHGVFRCGCHVGCRRFLGLLTSGHGRSFQEFSYFSYAVLKTLPYNVPKRNTQRRSSVSRAPSS